MAKELIRKLLSCSVGVLRQWYLTPKPRPDNRHLEGRSFGRKAKNKYQMMPQTQNPTRISGRVLGPDVHFKNISIRHLSVRL